MKYIAQISLRGRKPEYLGAVYWACPVLFS